MQDVILTAGIGITGALLGTIVGAFLGYKYSIQSKASYEWRAACSRFRESVHEQLGSIYPSPAVWPRNISSYLKNRFVPLQKAVGEFRHYLPSDQKAAFDKAWLNYHCQPGRGVARNGENYAHYLDAVVKKSDGSKVVQDGKNTFKQNVNAILSFTNL